MNKRDLVKTLLLKISACYQNFQVNKCSVDVWLEGLRNCHPKDVSLALEDYIKKEKFAPTIADIRQRAHANKRRRISIENSGNKILTLPDLSPEQIRNNQEKLKALVDDLAKKKGAVNG